MLLAVLTGALAGTAMGFVLQRAQLCFHAMFSDALARRTHLLCGWLLGVGIAAVGLSLLYLTPWSHPLNTGLPFRPVANIVGGLLIGVGMLVAWSCVSGLFYKLGEGMLGALVGLLGWAAGELVGTRIHLGGPTLLQGGFGATIPGILHVPRTAFAVVFLGVVIAGCRRLARQRLAGRGGEAAPRWSWSVIGTGLGAATLVGWVLARVGGSSYGPSTVGAINSIRIGQVNWWLVAFLVGLVLGAWFSARLSGAVWVRAEKPARYGRLVVGGLLLGAGGWIAGGCNLGHALSGAAQLNVSSWVVVAAMAAGVVVAGAVERLVATGSARRAATAAG